MRITGQPPGKRQGFTLIEMLVVMGILLVLATMVVAVLASPILVQDKARRGGSQLQMWFRIAKSKAVADGAPRGVRLIMDPDGFVRQLQYIEQPTDFIVMIPGSPPQARQLTIQINPGPPQTLIAQLQGFAPTGTSDFTSGLDTSTPNDSASWPVRGDSAPVMINGQSVIGQPGDYLEVQGGGLLFRIKSVFPDHLVLAADQNNVQFLTSLGGQLGPTSQWRVIRGPRVLEGETPLLLPQDIAIDIANCSPPPSAAGTSDILFAPSGRVLGQLGAQDRVVLWVCDVTRDPTPVGANFPRNGYNYATNRVYYQNNPMLVSIHSRTGFIAVHPVDISNSPGSDFSFTLDGRLSGL
jgi:prepilin-type N-terminal cleavage/methylation domain-containing protein